MKSFSERGALLVLLLMGLAISGISPDDRLTWILEVAPLLIGLPLLLWTSRSFPLTPLTYRLIFIHAIILMIGAHYTYAKTPIGFWVQDLLGFERNHYDRLGHLAQGFIPAIIAREILIRNQVIQNKKWLFFLVLCICGSLSACYELIEWAAALIGGGKSDAFLGTQGDPWDTQWDIFLAFLGGSIALLTLSKIHSQQINSRI